MSLARDGFCPGARQETRDAGSNRFTIFEPRSRSAHQACGSRATQPHRSPVRRVATFLTHLIATHEQVPQARENRRADPAEVIAAYQATIERLRKLNN